MAGIFCNDGVEWLTVQVLLGNNATLNWYLQLFDDANPVDHTDDMTSHTECTLSGYAEMLVSPGNWVYAVSAGVWDGDYPTITFTFDAYAGGVTIYGFRFVARTSGPTDFVVIEQLLSTPFNVPSLGGTLNVDFNFKYGECA